MITAKTWTVQINLSEDEGRTRAEAILRSGVEDEMRGIGHARLHPGEPDIPEIGDEVATSRALSELSHKLLDTAVGDLAAILHSASANR